MLKLGSLSPKGSNGSKSFLEFFLFCVICLSSMFNRFISELTLWKLVESIEWRKGDGDGDRLFERRKDGPGLENNSSLLSSSSSSPKNNNNLYYKVLNFRGYTSKMAVVWGYIYLKTTASLVFLSMIGILNNYRRLKWPKTPIGWKLEAH